jgi:PAS domain S-box-containing protein
MEARGDNLSIQDFPLPVFCVSGQDSLVVTRWNALMEQITGYSADEVVGKNPLSTSLLKFETKICWKEGPQDGEYFSAINTRGGRQLPVDLKLRSLETGEALMVVNEAAERTADSNKRKYYEEMIQDMGLPMFAVDEFGCIQILNKAAMTLSGYNSSEAKAVNLSEWCTLPATRQSLKEILRNIRTGTATSNLELEFRTKSRETRYLLAVVSPIADDEILPNGSLVIAFNVTDVAQHERAVASMALESRQLVDTANSPIFGIDAAGNVNEWNNKMAEITGYSGDEAFNIPFLKTFIPPALQNAVECVLQSAMKGRGATNFDMIVNTKFDDVRYLQVNISTRRDAENNIVGVVVLAQDVTEASKHDKAVGAMASELRLLIDMERNKQLHKQLGKTFTIRQS